MKNPIISIDRGAKSFAIFENHFDLVYGFEKYTDEAAAIEKAKAIVAEKTDIEPEIEYPSVTKMKVTYSKRG